MGTGRGDEDFEALFDAELSRCQQLALRIIHDPDRAEECAAEAFARAWARWSRLRRDPHGAGGWVLRVTANLAIDNVRRGPAPLPLAVETTSAGELATLHVALVAALAALPRRQREAVALRYLADLPEQEVADLLGVSPGSVKTHLHRGLGRLRQLLGPDDDMEAGLAFEP